MSPTLIEGDVVAWAPVDIKDVKTGDVIVFKSYIHWPDEKILVHRVSDVITNKDGEIRLETKGDNNKWTDQAGPHIPEPYIREENLMGKILSIGQQPLKIPFVGFLGIWINDGLDSLSQATSSKDPITYIGIFAPLTISIIILVISLFILPEKSKTNKEKIHFNIFGRRPIKLKKTIITFLIAYIVFLTVIHTFANESISASVGINADDPGGAFEFGKIKPGKASYPKDIPLINPGTMPVKGIIFGRGGISEFIPKKTFELENGETKSTSVRAISNNNSKNGSYAGEIMLYSSPFWIIFPNDFIQNLLNLNAEATVFILDILSAIILTTITLILLISITFIGDTIVIWAVDRSWRNPSRQYINKDVLHKISLTKENTKHTFKKNISWITHINFSDIKPKDSIYSSIKKPILAAIVIIPIIYFLEDQILAMFIAVLIAGLLAYLISCKIRSKIVLTVLTAMTLAIAHMIIQSNIVIISKEQTIMELIALTLGTIGIYLLLFALLLIPLSLVTWLIIHIIQNVKERKDPLLYLEGSCDL